jgi:hypothetical protein
MKVNFNQPFVNFAGVPISERVNGVLQLKTIRDVVAQTLFEGNWLMRKAEVTADDKMQAYELARRIGEATDAVTLTVEEAAIIKEAVLVSLNPGGYAQVVKLIEEK